MKSISLSPHASMAMPADPALSAALRNLFAREPMFNIVETGTYLGLGSTTVVAEALVASQKATFLQRFVTIECNRFFWEQACLNLERFPFVQPLWGLSVSSTASGLFMEDDEAINHPERFPDVYRDDYPDLKRGYNAEIRANVSHGDLTEWAGIDLLHEYLHKSVGNTLVVLDSAGGIGWLEFQIALMTLNTRHYFMLLDDIDHIKHFRSIAHVRERPNAFGVLACSARWALIEHFGN